MKLRWGIDLGGTKVEAVVLRSLEPLEIIFRHRLPTEAHKGYEHILRQVAKLVDEVAMQVGERPEQIGIGTPGANDPQTGLHKNSNSTALNGRPFKSDLGDLLGVHLEMANDANCFALAEATLGVVPQTLPDAKVVFGIIMGTGVGGGVVINGKVLNGHHGIGGEWGHNFLDDSGGPCYCGKTGCVEKILSGPSLEAYYQKLSGTGLRLPEIIAHYQSGMDLYAQQTVERLLHFFGKGFASVINILDPDAVVIGGGVGNIDLLYNLGKEEVIKNAFNPTLNIPFLKPTLGDSAGVFGAAMLIAE